MAPGPEHRQEPVAPDKIAEGDRAADVDVDVDAENVDTATTGSSNNSNSNDSAAAVAVAEQSSNVEIAPTNFVAPGADSANQSSPSNSGVDSKQ
ncbi:dentin sialophospho isoformx1, partial [Lasius niger]